MNCKKSLLKILSIATPLGKMIAISNEIGLYLLEFADRKNLDQEINHLLLKTKSEIMSGISDPLLSIQNELNQYFQGQLLEFKTSTIYIGTFFQKKVWEELKKIPIGITQSYAQMASVVGKPKAFRAVAKVNSTNQLAIIVGCHRIINSDGKLGGYSGGLERKRWLIDHEKNYRLKNEIPLRK